MTKPIEWLAALKVGTVESVSPDEIKVLLEIDAPQTTALNTGVPSGFPRINSYVLIPNEAGAVVGLVTWLGIEHSSFPKRTGFKDFGLIDLPYPLRKMALTPLGMLTHTTPKAGLMYRLERGVSVFPSVGDSVLLPTEDQLRSIVESEGNNRRVLIGTSPLAGNAGISVDPDKLFGRHLAVLGNTGSGKSCTVAGLIRWSLEAAKIDKANNRRNGNVNARFIILDPNGEYTNTFKDLNVRVFRVNPEKGEKALRIPVWMWNSFEWASLTEAKSGTQRPILMRALREIRSEEKIDLPIEQQIAQRFKKHYRSLVADLHKGPIAYMEKPGKNDFGQKLHAIAQSASDYASHVDQAMAEKLKELSLQIKGIADAKHKKFNDKDTGEVVEYYQAFSDTDAQDVVSLLDSFTESYSVLDNMPTVNEDAPLPFVGNDLVERIEQIGTEQGSLQYLDNLILRMRTMLSDGRLGPVINSPEKIEFEKWLNDHIGGNEALNGTVAVLDLSLIPSDVLHTCIAVIGRIVFEAVQRYRKMEKAELPTVIVLEEAHTFIRRSTATEEDIVSSTDMCRITFERIAREGRKFGLGLVLSSQRPSELSPTVLAQCNTFILHRIVNDRDQELVGKLVPDNLGGLLRELPSLPSRQAILLGWATTVPVLLEVLELDESHRPQSSDPHFWDVWTGLESRPIDWKKIAKDWTS